MSFAKTARLDLTDDIDEARRLVFLSVDDVLELCDISERTWYRWKTSGAPTWAIRLLLSQSGKLDHLGWTHWEIRQGCLYCNQLAYRYHWEPQHLVLSLYGVTDRAIIHGAGDNLSQVVSLRTYRKPTQHAVLPRISSYLKDA